jgi:hypothetical protein
MQNLHRIIVTLILEEDLEVERYLGIFAPNKPSSMIIIFKT